MGLFGTVVAVGCVVLAGDGVAVGCGAVVGTFVAVGAEPPCVLVGCGFVVPVGWPDGVVVVGCEGTEVPAGSPAVLVGFPSPPAVPAVVGDVGCELGTEPPPPSEGAACALPVIPDGPLVEPGPGVPLDPARGVVLAPAVAVDATPALCVAVADFTAPVAVLETAGLLLLVLDDGTAPAGSPSPPPPQEAATTPIVSSATTAAPPATSNRVRSGSSVNDESPRISGSRGNRILSLLDR